MADHPQDENSAPDQADAQAAIKDAHLAKGVAGAELPVDEYPRKTGKRDRSAAGLTSIWETVHRGARDMGVKRSLKTLLTLEPEGRLRLPGLRLARARRRPQDRRVLRERRQGGRRGGDARARRRRTFFAQHSIAELLRADRLWLGPAGPAHRTRWCCAEGAHHYEPISWDDAFALIARELRGARRRPDEAVVLHLGRAPATRRRSSTSCSSRQFGTNNLPDCSNMCHESSGVGADRDDRHRQGRR